MTTTIRAAAAVAGTAAAAVVAASAPALAISVPPAACGPTNVTVTSVHGPTFYIDPANAPALSSSYAGYRLTNNTGSALSDVWVQASNFTGGVVTLAPGQAPAQQIPSLAAGASTTVFYYLKASGATTVPQGHTVTIYNHRPDLGSSSTVCSTAGGFTGVATTIKASANKLTSITAAPAQPKLGSTFTVTVQGQTGTIGAGTKTDPTAFWMSAAATSAWPSNAYRLVHTSLTMSKDGSAPAQTTDDVLHLNGVDGPNRSYTATYTFRAVGVTPSPVTVTPVQEIASGTQIKHTDTSSITLPAIPPASNDMTLSMTASPTKLPSSGGGVDYVGTLSGSAGDSVDQLVVTPPAGATFVHGSATWAGTPIADPEPLNGALVFVGPFALTGSSADLDFRLTHDASQTGDVTTALRGYLGETRIDKTADVTDDQPATATVNVNTPPTAVDDSLSVLMNDDATSVDVLGNDTDADHDSLTVTGIGTAGHGTATLSDGTVTYAPDADYSGADSFTYTVSDSRGDTATGTVNVTVGTLAPQDDAETVDANSSATTFDVLGNDPQGAVLTTVSQPAHGSASIVDGSISYSPDAGFSGTDTFTYGIRHASAPATVTVTVTPLAQSITFAQPDDVKVGAGTVALDASASSGRDVTLSSATPSVCSVDGTTVTLLAVGTCTIDADQAGGDGYAAAPQVERSFAVDKNEQEITFPALADVDRTHAPVSLSATSTSGLDVTYTSETPAVCTVDSGAVSLLDVGTCTIDADQAGNDTWAAAPTASRSFVVGPAPQSIDFPAPSDVTMLAGSVPLVATATSGLDVAFSSETPGVCTVSGGQVTPVAAGTCVIDADQAGNGSWQPAERVWQQLTVSRAPQTVSFTTPRDTGVGFATVDLTGAAGATSGLDVAFASTTPAVCTVSGATVTLLAPGTCTVAASQDGNGTYAAAAPVSRSFQVLADGVAHDDSFTVGAATFGTPAASTLPVLANDDQGVTVQSVTQPASGSVAVRNGSVSFTPAPGFRGTVTFTYKAVDGLGFGSTGTVTVVVPDAAPVVSSSDVTTTSGRAVLVPVKGSDPNTDALATSVSAPAGATTAQVPGGVLVTPASTTSGLLKVTVRVTDPQGMTASTVATVTVRPAPAVSATRQLNGVGTTVRWTASAAAQGYQVVVGGRVVCTTTTKLTCALPQPIGPKVAVTIRVLGKDSTVSVLTAAKKIRAARPVLMTVAHFASGSATLSAGDAARIRAVAKRAAALGFDVLNVVGYTDSQGSTAYNQKLSAKRTAAVAALLHRSANTLRGVFGWAGENHPVKSNSSEQGRAANRRVEVWAQ